MNILFHTECKNKFWLLVVKVTDYCEEFERKDPPSFNFNVFYNICVRLSVACSYSKSPPLFGCNFNLGCCPLDFFLSMTVAMKSQAKWEVLDRTSVFYTGTGLIVVGTLLVVSSFLALGFTGTFLGLYECIQSSFTFTLVIERTLAFCSCADVFLRPLPQQTWKKSGRWGKTMTHLYPRIWQPVTWRTKCHVRCPQHWRVLQPSNRWKKNPKRTSRALPSRCGKIATFLFLDQFLTSVDHSTRPPKSKWRFGMDES